MLASQSREGVVFLVLLSSIPSSVLAKLTLPVPASGAGFPFPQNGVPIHRVRAHSLSRVHRDLYFEKSFSEILVHTILYKMLTFHVVH